MRGSERGREELRFGAADGIAVTFERGIVRIGRLASQDGRSLDVEFPSRKSPTLIVGSCTTVRLGARADKGARANQLALVLERTDRREGCRYRLLLQRGRTDSDRTSAVASEPPSTRKFDVVLRFGRLEFPAQFLGAIAQGLRLRVPQKVEARLHVADLLELVCTAPGATRAEIVGWIDRRVLDGTHVRYDFRFDEELTEDFAGQRARLDEILARSERDA
jgi:hypothetical protein